MVPDCLLVPDRRILLSVLATYPETPIVLVPNFYLDGLVQKIRNGRGRTRPSLYLFIGEPQRRHGIESAYDVDMFLLALEKAVVSNSLPGQAHIYVRPHPSQTRLQSTLPASFLGRDIRVLEGTSLVHDLIRAQGVFGFESFALEVSAASGIPTFSCLEPGMPQLELLHPSVVMLPPLVPS